MSITLNGSQLQGIPVVINGNTAGIINTDQHTSQASASSTTGGSIVISGGNQSSNVQLSEAEVSLQTFWQDQLTEIQKLTPVCENDFKTQDLPLARIKKIMKMDDEVKMISAEAPLLFAKAAHIFITELSLRAWIHTEESKRRTLQRNDIATAITKFDQFDFLIDIVPREELKPTRKPSTVGGGENMQYFYTVPQSGGNSNTISAIPQNQLVLAQTTSQGGQAVQPATVEGNQNQLLQIIQNPQQHQQHTLQQVVTSNSNRQMADKNQPQQHEQTIMSTISEMQQEQGNNQENIIQLNANNGQLQFPIRIQVQQNENGQNQVVNLGNMQSNSSDTNTM